MSAGLSEVNKLIPDICFELINSITRNYPTLDELLKTKHLVKSCDAATLV